MGQCIFCKIVQGEAPCIKVYEDDHTLAFMDVRPASPGHTLVISKRHVETIWEIDEPTLAAVSASMGRLAKAIGAALTPDGLRITQFNGAAAGQTVFHYHVHLVPTPAGQHTHFHGRDAADPHELRQLAARLRAALDDHS